MSVKCLACQQILPEQKVASCPHCKLILPPRYQELCKERPPLAIAAVGYPNHGKTNLLNSLTLTLERVDRKARGVYPSYLDKDTRELVRQLRTRVGSKEDATPTKKVERMLLGIHGLRGMGDHFLSLYDLPGECVAQLDSEDQPLPIPPQSFIVWMVVSLSDLEAHSEGNNLPGLLQAVHLALQRVQTAAENTRQTLIVIYTKAEKYRFAAELKEYLQSDPLAGIASKDSNVQPDPNFPWSEYLAELHETSQRLREFTQFDIDGGGIFVNMAADLGYELKFCLTSALGGDPQDGRLTRFKPYRVLDPLLLSLGLEGPPTPPPPTRPRLALVMDATTTPGPLYTEKLHLRIWNEMQARGDVHSFYLGVRRPVGHPGQQPPAENDRFPRLRLIGPLLDTLPSQTRVVVLSNGPVLDLPDFLGHWRSQVLLLRLDGAIEDRWPEIFPYRAGDDPKVVVDVLMKMGAPSA